jgi:hypothetical protein
MSFGALRSEGEYIEGPDPRSTKDGGAATSALSAREARFGDFASRPGGIFVSAFSVEWRLKNLLIATLIKPTSGSATARGCSEETVCTIHLSEV